MQTPIEELLNYIKTAHTFTFLPDQLASLIEKEYLPKEKAHIIDSYNSGEMNIWNHKRDDFFEYEGGQDYFDKTYKQP
jgi:hypothetical protein